MVPGVSSVPDDGEAVIPVPPRAQHVEDSDSRRRKTKKKPSFRPIRVVWEKPKSTHAGRRLPSLRVRVRRKRSIAFRDQLVCRYIYYVQSYDLNARTRTRSFLDEISFNRTSHASPRFIINLTVKTAFERRTIRRVALAKSVVVGAAIITLLYSYATSRRTRERARKRDHIIISSVGPGPLNRFGPVAKRLAER